MPGALQSKACAFGSVNREVNQMLCFHGEVYQMVVYACAGLFFVCTWYCRFIASFFF
jgi:hypothetical protein